MADKDPQKDEKPEAPADEGAAGEAQEAPRRRIPGKKIVLFAAPVVLLLVAGAGAHFAGLTKGLFGGAKPVEAEAEAPKPTVFYDIPEMLVNLNSNGRRSTFLKISVSLELETATDIPRIEAVMPRIIDSFQVYLRELRAEDLRGSTGLYRLREELLVRVNGAAQPARVNDILFKEMLVQ
jgi:flagellar FliL protein